MLKKTRACPCMVAYVASCFWRWEYKKDVHQYSSCTCIKPSHLAASEPCTVFVILLESPLALLPKRTTLLPSAKACFVPFAAKPWTEGYRASFLFNQMFYVIDFAKCVVETTKMQMKWVMTARWLQKCSLGQVSFLEKNLECCNESHGMIAESCAKELSA